MVAQTKISAGNWLSSIFAVWKLKDQSVAMIAVLLGPLLLSCTSEAHWVANKEGDLVQLVQDVLLYSNAYLVDHGLQLTTVPDFYHKEESSWFRLTGGKLGELSSLKLLSASKLDKAKDVGGGFVVSFNLTLSLEDFRLVYDNALSVLDQSPMYGTLELTAGLNSFEVAGTAEVGPGYCYAQLQSARTLSLTEISSGSNTNFSPWLTQKYIIDFMLPHIQGIVDNVLISFQLSPPFRAHFEDVLCHVISKSLL